MNWEKFWTYWHLALTLVALLLILTVCCLIYNLNKDRAKQDLEMIENTEQIITILSNWELDE